MTDSSEQGVPVPPDIQTQPAAAANPPLQGEPVMQPEQKSGKPGLTEGVWSVVLSVLALLFIPIILGPVSIYLGYRARQKGQMTLGTVGMALGVVCMVIGMFLGAVVSVWLKTHK